MVGHGETLNLTRQCSSFSRRFLIAALLLLGAVATSAWILGSTLVHPANHTVQWPPGFEDLAIDSSRNRLYASSAQMDFVLVFDLNGTRIGTLRPQPPRKLEEPSALALFGTKLYVLSHSGNRVVQIDL